MWRPEVDFLSIPQLLSTLFSLLLNQELAVLAKQATCLFPPACFLPELQAHITMPIFLPPWVLGI